MILGRAWRPVAGLASEHGAGDREQAVRDGTQGAHGRGRDREGLWGWVRAEDSSGFGEFIRVILEVDHFR